MDLLKGEKVDLKKPRAEKPKKEVRSFRVTRHLKVELSASEVDQRGRDAARFRRDIKSDEVELKSITSTFKARIATAEGQLDTALQEVDGRCTYRDVDCEEIWDHGELVVRLVRLDTGAEFERRNMTRDELQMNLPLPDKKAPKADKTKAKPERPRTPIDEEGDVFGESEGPSLEDFEEEDDETRSDA